MMFLVPLATLFSLNTFYTVAWSDIQGELNPSGVSNEMPLCDQLPRSTYFNLSDVTYDYPSQEIDRELRQSANILRFVFNTGIQNKRQNYKLHNEGSGRGSGCTLSKATLEGFHWRNNHCWVLYPKHQAVTFVRCGHPRCKGNGYSSCVAHDYNKPVWAFCLAQPYGRRITRVSIPIPTACSCSISAC